MKSSQGRQSRTNNAIEINERLRALRTQNHLTQQRVADSVGVRRPAYQAYEEGRAVPPLDTLLRLSELYGYTSINELLGHQSAPVHPLMKKYLTLSLEKKKIVDFILGGT